MEVLCCMGLTNFSTDVYWIEGTLNMSCKSLYVYDYSCTCSLNQLNNITARHMFWMGGIATSLKLMIARNL